MRFARVSRDVAQNAAIAAAEIEGNVAMLQVRAKVFEIDRVAKAKRVGLLRSGVGLAAFTRVMFADVHDSVCARGIFAGAAEAFSAWEPKALWRSSLSDIG